MDFFIPRVVRNPSAEAIDFGEQSEICTTWKGLSSVGAEELFTWTNIYRMVSKQRSEYDACSVNLSSIAVEMVKCYEQGPTTGLNWFLSAPNIYQRVERFLSMSMETPSLQVEELQVPVVGQEYTLALRGLWTSDKLSGGFGRQIVVSTSENWLQFDESGLALSGTVPSAPPRNIIVRAKVIEYLDERVRLEHVIRSRVDLRAKAGTCAVEDLSEILTAPLMDRGITNENAKPRKQVSFADEHEIDSLHSSPDHLRSFFNELSAMACDPLCKKNAQMSAIAKDLPREAMLMSNDFAGFPEALLGAKVAVKTTEGSDISFYSEGSTASMANNPSRRHLASPNSSSKVYPNPRDVSSELGESACASRIAGRKRRHNCARDSSCAGHHKASRTWDKTSSLFDADTNLDLEVALGLCDSGYDVVDDMAEPGRRTPLVFQNRFDRLSKCSNMDCPTQICDSMSGSESEAQHDSPGLLDHTAFGFHFSTEGTDKDEGLGIFEDLQKNLYQWNWKGWEKEMGMTKGSGSKRSMQGPPREDWQPVAAADFNQEGHESRLAMGKGPGGPGDNYRDDIQHERAVPGDRSLNLPGHHFSPKSSCATTDSGSRSFSDGSWSWGDEATVLAKATNVVDKSSTIYDTVRNQFYKDHRVRQMTSSRHSKAPSGRVALSSAFSSNFDHLEPSVDSGDYLKEEFIVCSSGPRNENAAASGSQTCELPASPSSLGSMDERDIESIAAAVKTSLATEVESPDSREKAEIRKGILHHQVMDLRMNARRRDFGSSNYDGIFWSSDGSSTDEKLDSTTD